MTWDMVELGEVLTQCKDTVDVPNPLEAKLISVQLHGKGAVQRQVSPEKAPAPFKGFRGRAGQVVYSRIWARRGAVAVIPPELDNVVVTNEFPIFTADPQRLEVDFFSALTRSDLLTQQLNLAADGTSGQNRVKVDRFLEIKIPLPPLAEQHRIAAILGEAQALGRDYRLLLDEVLEMKQNLAHAALVSSGVSTVPLEELVDINPRQPRNIPDETETAFVAMADVDEQLGLTSYERSTFREHKKGYTYFEQGDVLLAKITPCFENGKSGIATIPTDSGHGSTEFHVLRVKDHEHTSAQIIWSLLKSQQFLREGENSMRGSSGHRRVPDWFIRKYPVPVLETEHAESLTHQLHELDEVAALIRQQIKKAQELYASLSIRAFSGEL